jgi:hypothetical protein
MAAKPKKIFFPTTRLSELAARPGGMTRDESVAAATKSIEMYRARADEEMASAIAAMAAIACVPHVGNLLSVGEMRNVLRHADQIVTLAGTFGYDALDRATRSLCDVAGRLMDDGPTDMAPVAVHVQAMQLLAPGSAALNEMEREKVLAELAKVLTHFGLEPATAAQHGPV